MMYHMYLLNTLLQAAVVRLGHSLVLSFRVWPKHSPALRSEFWGRESREWMLVSNGPIIWMMVMQEFLRSVSGGPMKNHQN